MWVKSRSGDIGYRNASIITAQRSGSGAGLKVSAVALLDGVVSRLFPLRLEVFQICLADSATDFPQMEIDISDFGWIDGLQ